MPITSYSDRMRFLIDCRYQVIYGSNMYVNDQPIRTKIKSDSINVGNETTKPT